MVSLAHSAFTLITQANTDSSSASDTSASNTKSEDNIALLCLIVLISKDDDSALFGHLLDEETINEIKLRIPIQQTSGEGQGEEKQIEAGLKNASKQLSSLKRKLEKEALGANTSWWGYTKWLAMQVSLWVLLVLYALGCALSIFGGLISKFGKSVDAGIATGLGSLYGGFALISTATFYTNIIGLKKDCEDFVYTLFAPKTGNEKKSDDTGDLSYKQSLTRWFLSLTACMTLGLMTWHFMSVIPFMAAIPYANIFIIIIATATALAELMLTAGVLKTFFKAYNEWQKENDRSLGKALFGESFGSSSPWKKYLVVAVAVILTLITVLGLYALSKSGIDAMQDISFTKTLPQSIGLLMAIATCVSQLPLYLKGAYYIAGRLLSSPTTGESMWDKFKEKIDIKSIFKNFLKFTGFCTLGGAVATTSCIVLGGGLAVLSPHIVPVLVGVSIGYGAWLMLQYHLKSVRVLTNAAGNATLASSPIPSLGAPGIALGMISDGVMSALFGTYGLMNEAQGTESTENEVRDSMNPSQTTA